MNETSSDPNPPSDVYLGISAPDLVPGFLKSIHLMPTGVREAKIAGLLIQTKEFFETNDVAYIATLSPTQSDVYRAFVSSLKVFSDDLAMRVASGSHELQKPCFAQTAAMWQVINAFRIFHGDDPRRRLPRP